MEKIEITKKEYNKLQMKRYLKMNLFIIVNFISFWIGIIMTIIILAPYIKL